MFTPVSDSFICRINHEIFYMDKIQEGQWHLEFHWALLSFNLFCSCYQKRSTCWHYYKSTLPVKKKGTDPIHSSCAPLPQLMYFSYFRIHETMVTTVVLVFSIFSGSEVRVVISLILVSEKSYSQSQKSEPQPSERTHNI